MRPWRLLYVLVLLLAFFGWGVPRLQPAHADENFDVGLVSSYTIQNDGTAIIEQQFTLTNRKPTLYASQYAIEVGSNKVERVKVFDRNGAIPANIVATDKRTSIAITFDDIIVGEGKQRQFTVQFQSPDIAIISGNVLEVYIPRFSDLAKYDSYRVELRVPERFGQPARVNPAASSTRTQNGFTLLDFTTLGTQGVTALFGEKQVYDFQLRYHLENPTASVGLAQIALPPDTPTQRVQYLSLEPRPVKMETDADGNWIATYEVSAGKQTEVELSGKATLYLTPQPDLPSSSPLPAHLQSQKYWPLDDYRIIELAREHDNPRAIYDYVVGALTYNFERVNGPVNRLGAAQALSEPLLAACQEFTDLFIAVARQAGVPARRVTGYAYTENSRLRPLSLVEDVLHAWPEYYDPAAGRWIPVDPTWGNTTGGLDYFSQLDFNHFTFAINGVSDSLPYPAGSYKRSGEKTKDVVVNFGTAQPLPSLDVSYTFQKKPFWLAPFRNEYQLTIVNQTGVAWYHIPLTAAVSSTIQVQGLPETISLLPYQTQRYTFALNGSDWLRQQPVTLTLNLESLSSSHELPTGVKIIDSLRHAPINPIGLGVGLVVATLITGGLLVLRRRR